MAPLPGCITRDKGVLARRGRQSHGRQSATVCSGHGPQASFARTAADLYEEFATEYRHDSANAGQGFGWTFVLNDKNFASSKCKCIFIRKNDIGDEGWHAVMDGLTAVTSINTLNGVEGLGEMFARTAATAPLSGKGLRAREAVVAISRLLQQCETTLTELDLRCLLEGSVCVYAG